MAHKQQAGQYLATAAIRHSKRLGVQKCRRRRTVSGGNILIRNVRYVVSPRGSMSESAPTTPVYRQGAAVRWSFAFKVTQEGQQQQKKTTNTPLASTFFSK